VAYSIMEVQGIGPVYTEKLSVEHVNNTDDLLVRCGTPAGRKDIAGRTGISETLLLKWANHADLMRISGIGPQFAELLEASGVDSVRELRTRNGENLHATVCEVNGKKLLSGSNPTQEMVKSWIEQAGVLEPSVS